MGSTVKDIFDAVEASQDKVFAASKPAALLQTFGFKWVKDAYDKIGDLARLPRKSDSSQVAVALTRSYSLPADIYDGFNGIITIEFNSKPLTRVLMEDLQLNYGSEWLNPDDLASIQYFFLEDDYSKFSVLPPPGTSDATKVFRIIYTKNVPKPGALTDPIPYEFEAYMNAIPLYLIGRALDLEKQGRGATFLAEFEGQVRRKDAQSKKMGFYSPGEGVMHDFDIYNRRYRGCR